MRKKVVFLYILLMPINIMAINCFDLKDNQLIETCKGVKQALKIYHFKNNETCIIINNSIAKRACENFYTGLLGSVIIHNNFIDKASYFQGEIFKDIMNSKKTNNFILATEEYIQLNQKNFEDPYLTAFLDFYSTLKDNQSFCSFIKGLKDNPLNNLYKFQNDFPCNHIDNK